MNVDMNVQTNQYTGKQIVDYWNNSPDTLFRVFFHLYWNAFQPNSMMDVRSRRQGTIVLRKGRNGDEIADWDPRVEDRIVNLTPDEIGYEKVSSIADKLPPKNLSQREKKRASPVSNLSGQAGGMEAPDRTSAGDRPH